MIKIIYKGYMFAECGLLKIKAYTKFYLYTSFYDHEVDVLNLTDVFFLHKISHIFLFHFLINVIVFLCL